MDDDFGFQPITSSSPSPPQNAPDDFGFQPITIATPQDESISLPTPPAYKDQNFFQRVGTDINNRATMAAQTQQLHNQGLISKPEEIYQLAGKSGAGLMNDVLGEGVKSAATGLTNIGEYLNPKSTAAMKSSIQGMTPDIVSFLQGPTGQAGINALKSGADAWGNFKKQNPDAARNIESTVDIGQFLTASLPVSEDIISGITKAKNPNTIGIDSINSGDRFVSATEPVQQNYENVLKQEGKNWKEAEQKAKDATLRGDVIQSLPDKIEARLNEQNSSLSDDALKPLKEKIDKFNKYRGESVGADASGELPVVKEGVNAPLSEILSLRRGISRISKGNTNGDVRWAAGQALREVDDHLADHAAKAIINGDSDAWQSIQDAVDYSRQKFRNFGTNKKDAESNMFEKIITKAGDLGGLDNGQIVDAFGTTTKGLNSTGQTINRMLDNAGSPAAREEVRSRLAQGFIERAIEKASPENLTNPGRMRIELNRLISSARSVGGMDTELRNKIFTKDDIKSLIKLRDNMKDSKAWDGALRQLTGTYIPFAQQVMTKGDMAAKKISTRRVEDFLTQRATGAQKVLRGTPFNYAPLVGVGAINSVKGEPKQGE